MSETDDVSVEEKHDWVKVFVRVGLNTLTYPLDYAKVLIQLGYEPLLPYKSRTIFGREKLYYPSIFAYVKHIKTRDGFFGCYRGLSVKLISNVVSGVTLQSVTERLSPEEETEGETPKEKKDMSIEEKTEKFFVHMLKETQAHSCSIIASHPFHVITLRVMAQFVGREENYTGLVSSVCVIYKEEGISGFFSGLIPRMIYELGYLWLGGVIIHVINNYFVEDEDLKSYIRGSMKFLATSVMYPFLVVANCMAVNNSGLIASSPPLMPYYGNWMDCYGHLRMTGSLKRGSAMFWRSVPTPTYSFESINQKVM